LYYLPVKSSIHEMHYKNFLHGSHLSLSDLGEDLFNRSVYELSVIYLYLKHSAFQTMVSNDET